MNEINNWGRLLLIIGLSIAGWGLFWFGRLPGDIYVEKKNFSFYFPLATSILISIILSLVLWLIRRR